MSEQTDILSLAVRDFLASTAAKTPTPGGGSVAGVVGALGTALGEMALNFTRGKKKFAEHEECHAHLASLLQRARRMFEDLTGEDIAAYQLYQSSARLEEGPQRQAAMELATAAAINVPREVAKLSLAVLEDLKELVDKSNPGLITDLLGGAALAAAAVRLSDYNVRINVPYLSDKVVGEEIRQASAADVQRALGLHEDIESAARKYLP